MKNRLKAAITVGIASILSTLPAITSDGVLADELSDLRANQLLLQRRLDQLAQAAPSSGAVSAGVPGLAGSFPRSFLIPGTETSIRVGGLINLTVMHFFTGGNPNRTVASTSNFGNNGALNTAPGDVHNAPAVAGVFPLTGNPGRSRGNNITFISPDQSRLHIETRTPTAWGEARTYMEFDWINGNQFLPGNNALLSTNNLAARLRFAYASLGGLLAGQAYTNFADNDAQAESIEFGGNVGEGIMRIPQVRYTLPLERLAIPGELSVSAEAPDTDAGFASGFSGGSDAIAQNPSFTCTALAVTATGATTCTLPISVPNPLKSPWPDFTATWYIPEPWGHLSFSAVARPTLQIKDGLFVDRTFAGYGVHFGGDVKPGWFDWVRDDITFGFLWGDGIGRYVGGNISEFALVTNYPLAPPATAAIAKSVLAKTTISWGGNLGYQHWWRPNLRSNISFGILHHDITNVGNSALGFVCSARSAAALGAFGGCALNKELISTHANVLWNPVPFADIGLEYFWGHRLVLGNLKGDVNGLISRFRVSF